ncbi:S-layer homology domain-containing protein [Bacillus sp. MMSF_3328]|uniref:S-layer homology domain-containing protein n=1 Tax=Bacillus sp. MMSF_3328 TaxID=3047080 RepID=UPI00273DF6F2|nr:S-layer homology domain-containing protein [Bacillus sp. MMSF_3328]
MAYQPKSYRKFIATAATATIVASAVAPAASAASVSDFKDVAAKYQDAVNYLVVNGITQGTSDTTFGTHDNVKRGDAAIWLAKALKLDLTNVPASGFSDTGRYDAAVSALKAKGVISGKTQTTFAPNALLTRGEMAKILANAYELESDAKVPFTDLGPNFGSYIKALYEYGVTQGKTETTFGTSQNITRGDLAIFLKRAAEVVKTLEVSNVSAVNAKEIVIDFNTAVDEVTAENESNYSLTVAGAGETNFTAEVDENNAKRVVLTLTDNARLANNEAVQLTVKKSVLNSKLEGLAENFSKTWVFSDTTAPTITEVVRDGSDVKVTFDDYVSSVELAKVGGVDKTGSVAAISGLTKTVTISGGASGLASGSHQVLVSGVTDAAGNKSSVLTGSVVISDDTTAPTVSKVEQLSDNTLKVTFNKEVTGANFAVKKGGYNLGVVASGSGKEYTLTLSDNGQIKVYDTNQSTSNVVVEVSGFKATSNNLYGTTYTSNVTLSKDQTAPTVVTRFNEIVDVDATAGVNEVFNVRFNESIKNADLSKLTLTDKDGVRQAINSATIVNDASGNPTILQVASSAVQTNGAFKIGNYSLNLAAGAVKDLAGNNNSATTVSFTKSASASTVSASAVAANNVITVSYSTTMTTSATTLANYMLDGKALPAGTNIYFDGNTQTVKIELPAASVASTGGAVLTISDSVVSTAGSKVAAADRTENIAGGFVDNVKPVLTAARKASSTSVELTFSENVDATTLLAGDNNDFVVSVNGTTVAYTGVVDGVVGDNKISLTVPTYNTSQTVTVGVTDNESNISLEDITGNKLTKSTVVTAN